MLLCLCVITLSLSFLGFEGHNCENNVDDCPGHKCMNGGICVDGVNTYNCQCPPEWTGIALFTSYVKLTLNICITVNMCKPICHLTTQGNTVLRTSMSVSCNQMPAIMGALASTPSGVIPASVLMVGREMTVVRTLMTVP